jgi:hypothetical protein
MFEEVFHMRTASLLVLSGLLLVFSAVPALAVPPDHEPAPNDPVTFDAGVVCDFAVEISGPGARQTMHTFYDRDGNPRATVITGFAPGRFTNVDTGASILVRGGQAVELVDPGDGTFRIESSGEASFYFFEGDANPVGEGKGLWVVRGQAVTTLDLATNVVTDFVYTGALIDVCAALED